MTLRNRSIRALFSFVLVFSLLFTMNLVFTSAIELNSYAFQVQGLDRSDLIPYNQAKIKGHVNRLSELENEHAYSGYVKTSNVSDSALGALIKVTYYDSAGTGITFRTTCLNGIIGYDRYSTTLVSTA